MGIVTRGLEGRGLSISDLDSIIEHGYYGPPNTATGININEMSALRSIGVLSCVQILSRGLATPPLKIFERLNPGRQEASGLNLYHLLHDQPNPEMSSYKWRETKQGHLSTWGNAYSEIEWNMSDGTIKALWPLRPDKMEVSREKNGRLWYVYTLPNGKKVGLPAWRVFHVKGFGFNGLTGYSPIGLAREGISLDMAAERHGNRFFKNDARPGGVVRHPKTLSKEAKEFLRDSWERMHQGLDNAHRVAILDEGMEWQSIGLPNKDIQYIENRKFQKAEIATLYNVPLHMVNLQEKSSSWGSGIAEMTQGFIDFTMLPWYENWEQEIFVKLLLPKDQKKYYAEFVTEYYLRGDLKDRAEYQTKTFGIGKYSINEVREKDNQNPIDGPAGDYHFVPMNYVPVELIGKSLEDSEDGRQAARQLNLLVRAMNPQTAIVTEETGRSEKDNKGSDPPQKTTVRPSLSASFVPIISDTALRIIRGERRNISREAKKQLRNITNLEIWLDEYYRDKHPPFVRAQMLPVFTSLATAIQAAAAEEVGQEAEVSAEQERFVSDYTDTFIARYIKASNANIKKTLRVATEEEHDHLEALDEMFDRWEETRPGKIAMRENIQLAGAIAALTFAGAGYRLMWGAVGKSCPYCEALDGTIISYGGAFLDKGDSFQPDGVDAPLTTSSRIGNPPAHPGCDCTLFPA